MRQVREREGGRDGEREGYRSDKDRGISSRAGVGNLFSAKGHLDIYNIIRGPYRIINLKISLLYLVKH